MMKKYIDADKLKEKLKEFRSLAYSDFGSGMLVGNEKAQAALEMMPTADVVEVIFCKDCKYYERYSIYDDDYYCMAEHTQSLFSPNKTDFCSHGERKEITTEGDSSDA